MSTPTFIFPACPECSSIHSLEAPFWRLCRSVSKRDDQSTYSLIGCVHAESLEAIKFLANPQDWGRVELAWEGAVARLFDRKTADWTPERKEQFAEALKGKAQPMPEEKPAQVRFTAPFSEAPKKIVSAQVIDDRPPEPPEPPPVLTPTLDPARLEEIRLDEEVPF